MLVLLLCTLALTETALTESPQISTSQGRLRGQVLQSRGGRDYFSYTKVPYAKPPIGERRFKISEKADNWTGVLDATQPTPACYQTMMGTSASGVEDCLYLNVFTPHINGRLPVIFSIHGGAFLGASADLFGAAEFFMDEDVVFVAPNYRVGILGFLSLEDNVISGNMGLKDQALALEWVHKEISAFGGDPNMITVIGESAGAESSNAICSAPRTSGLIKGCVSQSGNAWKPWSHQKPGIAKSRALNLIKAVGCGKSEDRLKCLQRKPVELVANLTLLTNGTVDLYSVSPIVTPIMEPASAPGALLTVWPPVPDPSYPWITGVCQDEGLLYTGPYEYKIRSQEETELFINDFNRTIIRELSLENKPNAFQKIRERFFTKGVEPLRAIRNFFTEYMFVYPTLKGVSRHSGPTYLYKFNYTGGPQMIIGYNGTEELGVGHASEMPYFFNTPFKTSSGWPKAADIELSKLLVKRWANFAKDQTPNSEGIPQWLEFKGKYYYDIKNSNVTVEEFKQYQEILDFWENIFSDQPSKSSTIQSSLMFVAAVCIINIYKSLFL